MHQAPSSSQIERRLTTLFPSGALEDHAEAVGVIEREGKFQIPPLVWSFAFGFATGESRTLAAFRRSYNSTADESLSPGGYYQRLTPLLAEYLRDLVEYGLDEVAVPHTMTDKFDRFRDVMIADGTVLRLHQFLSDEFEGRKEEQAGARLHLLHNPCDQTLERFSITDEKAHDSTEFNTGSWLEQRLVLFDQAYFKYRRFALIDENDGYFVSRLKPDANPVITDELREWCGHTIPLEGKQIHDVVDDLHRKYIDVEVEVEFKRGKYNGTRSQDTKQFRVVGVRNEDTDDYHLYITNLTRKEFFPKDLATIYRCRWTVERLFRELKTQYKLDEFDTTKEHIVKILVYAALLSLLVSRELLALVTECAEDEAVFPPGRWAATFRSHAQLILNKLTEYLGYSPPPLLERLIEDAQKIHQQRPVLQETLATATQPRMEA
ncbi:putative transposase [Natrinema hispanicum]|uniref:Putative transposase n=1 Tax=Natrinema hispanicum TaxID=392421 RepID=A0A482YC59_9EURY|nr:IS4 family transposase [Natrinema hispanicum]RZV06478.1 putative transposase [Natrinema hispanicum]